MGYEYTFTQCFDINPAIKIPLMQQQALQLYLLALGTRFLFKAHKSPCESYKKTD